MLLGSGVWQCFLFWDRGEDGDTWGHLKGVKVMKASTAEPKFAPGAFHSVSPQGANQQPPVLQDGAGTAVITAPCAGLVRRGLQVVALPLR